MLLAINPCGNNSGWLHVRILLEADLGGVIKVIEISKIPSAIQSK